MRRHSVQKELHEKVAQRENRMLFSKKLIDYLIVMSDEAHGLGLCLLLGLGLGCRGFEEPNNAHTTLACIPLMI